MCETDPPTHWDNKTRNFNFNFFALSDNHNFILLLPSNFILSHIHYTLGIFLQTDIAGHDWYDFLIPEDREILRQNLTFEEPNGNDDDENLNYEKNVTFTVRMCQRSMSRRDQTHYEILKCRGVVRYSDGYKLARRERTRGTWIYLLNNMLHKTNVVKNFIEAPTTANDIVFVGSARLQKECIKDLSFLDMNQDEYVTRHLVDGRIVFCDQRISMVAGYMSEEVYGLSAFRFMHKDDVRWTMIGLRQSEYIFINFNVLYVLLLLILQ